MDRDRRRQVLTAVRGQFRLEWRGIHGVAHWARVRLNGLAMARVTSGLLERTTRVGATDVLRTAAAVAQYRPVA